MFAVDIVAPQFGHRQLIEAGKLVDRGVFLVPADIATAISRPRLVDGTSPVRPEELAGAEARFDPFAAFAVTFDDVALLELAHCESQELGQSSDVVSAGFDITSRPAAECRAFQAVERLAGHAASLAQEIGR